jgi:hypothetical protein
LLEFFLAKTASIRAVLIKTIRNGAVLIKTTLIAAIFFKKKKESQIRAV